MKSKSPKSKLILKKKKPSSKPVKTSTKKSNNKNNNNTKKIPSHQKKKSFRDEVLGPEDDIASLPKGFFEKILEYEVKLKENSDEKIIKTLIELYTVAIGFYQRKNDPKWEHFNQSLHLLFSQPEVQKYLFRKDIKKNEKKEKLEQKISQAEKSITEENAKNFIQENRKRDKSKEKIDKLIGKDMDSQKNKFKERLAEKKKKYILSTSDLTEAIDTAKGKRNLTIFASKGSMNKSFDIATNKNEIDDLKFNVKDIININSVKTHNNNNNNINVINNNDLSGDISGDISADDISNDDISLDENNNNNNILDELKNEDAKIEFKPDEDINNIKSIDKKQEKIESGETPNSSTKSLNFTSKRMFLDKLKSNFDIYANDYFESFFNKMTDNIIKEYNDNFNELTKKIIESNENYTGQIKEMSFLLKEDCDEAYKSQIWTIVGQLELEEKEQGEKIVQENEEKLKKLDQKYGGNFNVIQSSHGIEMIKEKFKLDLTKSINAFILKK